MRKNERNETKKEEIRHRQYLIGTYYAQGKGNDQIIELLKRKHSLSVSRATIGRDIFLIRRKNVEALKMEVEGFSIEAFWSQKLLEIARERERLWEIAGDKKARSGGVSALKQIQALRSEEIAIYERLGVGMGKPAESQQKILYVGFGDPERLQKMGEG